MKQINYDTLEVDGIDTNDAPDFSDAYFCYGEYADGTELSGEALVKLSFSDLIYTHVNKTLGT